MRQLFSAKDLRSADEASMDGRVAVKLPVPLRKQFHLLCIQNDTSMSDVLAAFVEIFVNCNGEVEIIGESEKV